MHQSNQQSRRTVKLVKGNHRRKRALAKARLGL